MEKGAEVGGIPRGAFAPGFDGSLVFCRANEVDGEVSDGGHVSGAVAFTEAGQVLPEGDVEHPVELVLDAPVSAHGLGEGFGR